MQTIRILGAMAAAAVAVSGTAHAQTAFRGQATLAAPLAQVKEATVAGVPWRCEGDACTGYVASYGRADPLVDQCKRVAAIMGPVTAFEAKKKPLSIDGLAACNAGLSAPTTVARK